MGLLSKIGEKAVDDEKLKLYGEEYIQKQKYSPTNNLKDATDVVAKSAKDVQFDEPIPLSLGNFNIDSNPESIGATDVKLPNINGEWKSVLFGPKGLLTEIFHFVNEKRQQVNTPQQSDVATTSDIDFPKILDVFLKSNGDFDDPKIPELPIIGICNRLSCGDIYKALDEFKKSEFFSNFQTALSLIHDPKGLDIIGELLENPELIEQFAGKPENIGEVFGKAQGVAKKKTNSHSMSILPSDGDLGIDFTSEIDPQSKKVESKPDFAANVDGSDYYSSVDKEDSKKPLDYDYIDTVNVEETIPTITTTTEVTLKKTEPPLPELSFSVDELPEIAESIDTIPEYGSSVVIEEKIPPKSENFKKSALERRFFIDENDSKSNTTTTTTQAPTTSTMKIFKTTQKIFTTTTKRNFRKDNDYYSMYYDN